MLLAKRRHMARLGPTLLRTDMIAFHRMQVVT
jgi:hypothetical protein